MADQYVFNERSVKRIARAVRIVESMSPAAPQGNGGARGRSSGWWGEITANNGSGRYSLKKMQPNGSGGLTDADPAFSTDYAYEVGASPNVADAAHVWVRFGGYDGSGNAAFYFGPVAPLMIPVTLASDGGSAGDQSTQCSFTYTATSLAGNEIDTSITPSHQRPPVGKMLAATRGYGHYDSSGNFLIWISDEMLDTGECS